MRNNLLGDTVIGVYAGMNKKMRYWHLGEQGDEMMLWSSPLEAQRYLVRAGAPLGYHNFYPMVFGEIMAGLSLKVAFRMSQATMTRFLEVWRTDMPDLPATASINLGEEDYVRFPPLVEKNVKKEKKTLC